MKRIQQGFTLVEIAIVLVIIGLLLGAILRGQELIQNARVRNVIDQQNGIKAAYFGFLDRYRALPGDLTAPQATAIGTPFGTALTVATVAPGNGTIGANDSPIAFQNLTATGFITCSVCTATAGAASSSANSPTNPFGGALQLVNDATYSGTAPSVRLNIKTGGQIASNLLFEMDTKTDDGNPTTGGFRFSTWNGSTGTCVTGTTWSSAGISTCGGATLL